MSAAAYDLLDGRFDLDLDAEFEHEAPPYDSNASPPTYKPKSVSAQTVTPDSSQKFMVWPPQYAPHDHDHHHLSTVRERLSPGAGPDDASKLPICATVCHPRILMFLDAPYRVIGV